MFDSVAFVGNFDWNTQFLVLIENIILIFPRLITIHLCYAMRSGELFNNVYKINFLNIIRCVLIDTRTNLQKRSYETEINNFWLPLNDSYTALVLFKQSKYVDGISLGRYYFSS